MTDFSNNPEVIRLKYLYRKLIIRVKFHLPLKDASKLVGPDCAYHLYSVENEDLRMGGLEDEELMRRTDKLEMRGGQRNCE